MPDHSVDIPVTDLDDDDDDVLTSTDSELESTVFRDDFEIDDMTLNSYGSENGFVQRIKRTFGKWASKGYSHLPKSAANGIELRENYRDRSDSFELSDDDFIIKRQASTLINKTKALVKKYSPYSIIVTLLIVVVILSVLLSQKRAKSYPIQFNKAVLSNGTNIFYPTTILISLDGFHPHYISPDLTPTLHKFLSQGYGAPYMIPSFPTSTFPNHWTIATGLYPQNHGIVGNTFYDPNLKREFINVIPSKSLDPVFWGGEPIWSTAEKNNVRSAIHMFPGSEVNFPKWNPTEVDKYNGTETLEAKADKINSWLDRDLSDRPELIIAYVPTIDSLGHKHGIKGPELEQGLRYVDSFLSNITQSIEKRSLSNIVNLIIVSDHGMAPTSNDRLIYLDDLLDKEKIEHIDGWPLFGLRPYSEYSVKEVFGELQKSFKKGAGYNIYLREDLPERFMFGGSRDKVNNDAYFDRVAPIWVVPDVGYSVTTHDEMARKNNSYTPKGTHGYDNAEVLMRAIFLGDGPYFRKRINEQGRKIKPFPNIEIYNILCETLNITSAPNNGTKEIFNNDNLLPSNWKDPQTYPGVKFDIGGILKSDSSYDALFEGDQARYTTTVSPPAGTTATENENPANAASGGNNKPSKTSDALPKETDNGGGLESSNEDPNKSNNGKEKEKQKGKDKDKEKGKGKEKEKEKDKDKDKDKSKVKSKGKGFFEKIGDQIDDFIDDMEELAEDVGEGFEKAYDKIMDEFND